MSFFRIYIITILFHLIISCNNSVNNPIYTNKNYSIDERIEDLISKMTLEEKIGQMSQFVGLNYFHNYDDSLASTELLNDDSKSYYDGLLKKDIAKMVVDGKIGSFLHVLSANESNQLQNLAMQSRLKIPLIIGIDALHGNGMVKGSTIYPSPISIASTFTDSLSYIIGKQTAKEVRASGSHWTFSPNIDVLRDPRWGRVGETFGEDPVLVSNMGVNMIKGLQQNNEVIACVKHFIGGSEPVNGLNFSPMDISERALREVFLKPYVLAINSGVGSLMVAHHEVNGIPCHMNKYLLQDILVNELDFRGVIISDWMDVERLFKLHNVARSKKEASLLSVNAGIDVNMHGPDFFENILSLVKENIISEERIEKSVKKILKLKFDLGLFDNPFSNNSIDNQILYQNSHKNTSLDVARRSIVLLKNNKLLPLKKVKENKNILVTGPNANNHSILGDWTLNQPENRVKTIFEGIKEVGLRNGYKVEYFNSNNDILDISAEDISKAALEAKNYDYVVVVLGDNSLRYLKNKRTAGENVDRSSLKLAGNQLELLKEIKNTNSNIILVYVNGRPIAENWTEDNINSIIEAWEPGSLGGLAVGEIIFGEVNPSGKLPITFPRSVGQLQMIYNHKPSQYYRKYAFEDNIPLYPFGHGLSYSKLEYSDLTINFENIYKPAINLLFTLQNKSELAADEIVQVYFRDSYSSVTRPIKELVDYRRINVGPREIKHIKFKIPLSKLAFLDIDMNKCVEKRTICFYGWRYLRN